MLVSLNGRSLIEGTNITLNFFDNLTLYRLTDDDDIWAEGILSGFAGCNAYGGGPDSGPHTVTDDGTLTIPQLAVTLLPCLTPEGVMEQEDAYLKAFEAVTHYELVPGELRLTQAFGLSVLEFVEAVD